jgi:hypothetical protein
MRLKKVKTFVKTIFGYEFVLSFFDLLTSPR